MTDSGGNGIRSRVRFGARRNQGVGSRTCLASGRGIRVAIVIPVEPSLEKRRLADSVLRTLLSASLRSWSDRGRRGMELGILTLLLR